MESLRASDNPQNILSGITEWWRTWMNRRAAIHDLNCCGEDEIAHIARDVGVGPSELRTLAGKWPDRADLLSRRIAAIGLHADQLEQAERQVMRDLQRVCTQCADHWHCARDLNRDASDRAWRDYCRTSRRWLRCAGKIAIAGCCDGAGNGEAFKFRCNYPGASLRDSRSTRPKPRRAARI